MEPAIGPAPPSRINDYVVGGTMIFSICFGIGLFVALLFLFIRFLPVISMAEMRELLPQAKVEESTA